MLFRLSFWILLPSLCFAVDPQGPRLRAPRPAVFRIPATTVPIASIPTHATFRLESEDFNLTNEVREIHLTVAQTQVRRFTPGTECFIGKENPGNINFVGINDRDVLMRFNPIRWYLFKRPDPRACPAGMFLLSLDDAQRISWLCYRKIHDENVAQHYIKEQIKLTTQREQDVQRRMSAIMRNPAWHGKLEEVDSPTLGQRIYLYLRDLYASIARWSRGAEH